MMHMISRALRNVPVVGEVAKYFYAKNRIKELVETVRHGAMPPEIAAFEGEELESKLEGEAQLLWTQDLDPGLKLHGVPMYMRTFMEKGAVRDLTQAKLARAQEVKQEQGL